MGHPRPAACVRWAGGGFESDLRVGPQDTPAGWARQEESTVIHLPWARGLGARLRARRHRAGVSEGEERSRGLVVHFQVGDALKLDQLSRTFDTVIDCGLFHTFSDEERPLYVAGLTKVVRPEDVSTSSASAIKPPGQGPRLITQDEIRDAFRDAGRSRKSGTSVSNNVAVHAPGVALG